MLPKADHWFIDIDYSFLSYLCLVLYGPSIKLVEWSEAVVI